MKIVKKLITELLPADYNPRKDLQPTDNEYKQLKRSIEEFGYVEPIIYNIQTGVVVGGHQRLKVLSDLGYSEVDCVEVDIDITKEKALNIALNKISGDWDEDKLKDLLSELQGLDFDMDLTGFDEVGLCSILDDLDCDIGSISKGIDKERDYDMERFDDENWMKFSPTYDGYYGFPLVKKDKSMTKEFFEGVEAIGCKDGQYHPPTDPENYCFHFFREDNEFKKYWYKPDTYIEVLRKYKFVLMPDFSTYIDYPYSFQIWNLYRKCWVAAYWQQVYDLKVVPVLSWSDEGSFDWCFNGIEKGSVVAVCSKGTQCNEKTKEAFLQGYERAIATIEPPLVLFFDKIPDGISNRDKCIQFSSMREQYDRIKNKK